MKPLFKPQKEGQVTKMIESHLLPLRRLPKTNEITVFQRERYFMAREYDGLKWFEIDRQQYLESEGE